MTVEAIEAALDGAGDADDGLRETVRILASGHGVSWAGIAFQEEGGLVLGPSAGEEDEERRTRLPISYQGRVVGELWADGEPDHTLLARVAELISAHVLLGWDTGGQAWDP